MNMADGAESLVISFLLPVLGNQWKLSDEKLSWLGTFIFLGFFFGSISSGLIGDKYGRRKPLLISNVIFTVFGLLSGAVDNYT
jgi:MFS family permease